MQKRAIACGYTRIAYQGGPDAYSARIRSSPFLSSSVSARRPKPESETSSQDGNSAMIIRNIIRRIEYDLNLKAAMAADE